MKRILPYSVFILLIGLINFSSCKKEESTGEITTQQDNRVPIANAGADQTISLPTNSISLNGSGSTDPDNNIASYAWTKISGNDLCRDGDVYWNSSPWNDHFYLDPNVPLEVAIQLDTATTWTNVRKVNSQLFDSIFLT